MTGALRRSMTRSVNLRSHARARRVCATRRTAASTHVIFARPEVYEALEERGVKYAIRIPANESLERDIAELLPRPVGRPSQKPLIEYKGFLYQAASWKTARRVVAKVEHHAGELFPRVGFIVTNLTLPSRAVVRFYNKRGTSRAVDQGRQAGGEDDTAELSPIPVERGASVAECDRLQSGEPVAAAGAAEEDRQVVGDELATAAGENRRPAGEACPILLASVGREPSDATALRVDAPADRAAALASGVVQPPERRRTPATEQGREKCRRHRPNEA